MHPASHGAVPAWPAPGWQEADRAAQLSTCRVEELFERSEEGCESIGREEAVAWWVRVRGWHCSHPWKEEPPSPGVTVNVLGGKARVSHGRIDYNVDLSAQVSLELRQGGNAAFEARYQSRNGRFCRAGAKDVYCVRDELGQVSDSGWTVPPHRRHPGYGHQTGLDEDDAKIERASVERWSHGSRLYGN